MSVETQIERLFDMIELLEKRVHDLEMELHNRESYEREQRERGGGG